MMPKSYL